MTKNFSLRIALVLTLSSSTFVTAQTAPFNNLRPGLTSSTSADSVAAAAAVDTASAANAVFSRATALMVANTARSLVPSPPTVANQSATATSFSTAMGTMVANRSRTLGNKPDGSGTAYFAASDVDLKKLTPQQQLRRLSPPPVTAGDGVRKLDIYIDMKDPLLVHVTPGQSVDIGSAAIKAKGVQNVEVNASIFLNGIAVLNQ